MPKKILMLVCGGGCVVVVIEMDDSIPSGWQLIFSGTYNCIAQKITQIAQNAQQRVKYRVNGKRTELLVHYTNQYNNRQQNVTNQKMETKFVATIFFCLSTKRIPKRVTSTLMLHVFLFVDFIFPFFFLLSFHYFRVASISSQNELLDVHIQCHRHHRQHYYQISNHNIDLC